MEPLDIVSVIVRAAAFVAALQSAGLAWFGASCRRSSIVTVPSLQTLTAASAWLAIGLVLAHRGLDAGRLAGEWPGILDPHLQGMVFGRRPGLSSMVCAAGLLAVAAGGVKHTGGWVRLGSLGAIVVVGSFALTGHTTAASHAAVLQGLLALHVGLAAYWLGAVTGLYWLTGRSEPRDVAHAAERFSAAAVWLVPLILPIGAALIWGLLPDLAALRTVYGGFLLAKVSGFCVLLVLAAMNRLRSLPSLAAGGPGAMRNFKGLLISEYIVLCSVLAATATMTSLVSWH